MTDRLVPSRDRDNLGRARNARPRDALGRPLPRDEPGAPLADQDYSRLSSTDALALAEGLLAAGRPFEAHEVFEARWKAAPAEQRQLWQGLAQLAVAITHAMRGNRAGAARVLQRARSNLLPFGHEANVGSGVAVDVAGVVASADGLLKELERGRAGGEVPTEIWPPRLAKRLIEDED